MNNHKLIKADYIIAHSFENLQDWNYIPAANIEFKEVQSVADLKIFDDIANTAFQMPGNLTYQFLK